MKRILARDLKIGQRIVEKNTELKDVLRTGKVSRIKIFFEDMMEVDLKSNKVFKMGDAFAEIKDILDEKKLIAHIPSKKELDSLLARVDRINMLDELKSDVYGV